MTTAQAIETVRRVGSITAHGGKLRLAFPQTDAAALAPVINVLRTRKVEVLAILLDPSETLNRAGVRILQSPERGYIIAIPAASDGPEVRRALEVLGMGRLPVWVVA